MPEMAVKLLKGPVSVAFSKRGRFHYATALEYDLVGIGSSRDKALSELQDVVNIYLTETDVSNSSGCKTGRDARAKSFAFRVTMAVAPAARAAS